MHRALPPLATALLASLALTVPACTPSGSSGRQPAVGGDSAPEPQARPVEPSASGEDEPDPQTGPVAVAIPPQRAVRPVAVPRPTGPYRVHIVDSAHRDLPTYAYGGRTYVMGTLGARYSVVVTNPTGQRVEAVVSVDGLDAIDGHPANFVEKRGYILPAYGDATIDGFRTSMDEVATFRFSSVADSYAGRLGQARDVGVIGVAFFPEQAPAQVWRPQPSEEKDRYPPAPPAPRPSYHAPARSMPAQSPPAGAGQADLSSGGAPAARAEPPADKRPGLGTEFGEARESHIGSTVFERASATTPAEVVSIRYNNRAGLIAMGVPIPAPVPSTDDDLRLRQTAEPFRQNGFAQAPPPRD